MWLDHRDSIITCIRYSFVVSQADAGLMDIPSPHKLYLKTKPVSPVLHLMWVPPPFNGGASVDSEPLIYLNPSWCGLAASAVPRAMGAQFRACNAFHPPSVWSQTPQGPTDRPSRLILSIHRWETRGATGPRNEGALKREGKLQLWQSCSQKLNTD